jgi:hypothetical protein
MYFDRFDICEAWAVWAHDFGAYAVITRLARMGFRARPSLSYATLNTNSLAIYASLAARS